MSITKELIRQGKIEPPPFLSEGLVYETKAGSTAYGVANEFSDIDVRGFCVPPQEIVFPHLRGEIVDFGRQKKRFNQFEAHHLRAGGVEYDVVIFSIVKFFHLAMDNNPNVLEVLFTPEHCITHESEVWKLVRKYRKVFLHKGSFHRFRGFSYSQINKAEKAGRSPERIRKYMYHAVRLLLFIEEILEEGSLTLNKHVTVLKAIRNGNWYDTSRGIKWCAAKEKELEKLYKESEAVPHSPDEDAIKTLLLWCLMVHWGHLEEVFWQETVEKGRENLLAFTEI